MKKASRSRTPRPEKATSRSKKTPVRTEPEARETADEEAAESWPEVDDSEAEEIGAEVEEHDEGEPRELDFRHSRLRGLRVEVILSGDQIAER